MQNSDMQDLNMEDPDIYFKLPTPTSLLVELCGHQTAAWERFSQLYGRLIFRWLVQFGISDRAERQDYMYDICIHVMEHIHQYHRQQEKGGFRAWLKVVVTNFVMDRQRKHEQEGKLASIYESEASKIMDPHSSVLETVIKREQEEKHALNPEDVENMDEDDLYRQGLIKTLGDRFSQRDIDIFFQLSCEKKNAAQVGELLGLTTANVKKIRQRVRDYLKVYLKDMDDNIVTDEEDSDS